MEADETSPTSRRSSNFLENGTWNQGRLEAILPRHIVQMIPDIPIDEGSSDRAWWKGHTSRQFSIKSSWEQQRATTVRRQQSGNNSWLTSSTRPSCPWLRCSVGGS
ncbi:hypothetical protein Salat_1697600 [Sesamum alatum]|uniref:Uncharacterized protein n=1 Tax=Sesamum alatum TaxID=300844 RepID=A0AAE1Y7J5_9LAMI|nr:hypothetical protein Salat_1697600 [Sesamum alatum]